MGKMQVFKLKDKVNFNILGLEIRYYKHSQRSRFSKKTFLECKTLRCKILYIISLIFNLKIIVPDFEWKARGCDIYGKEINR